MANNDEFYMKMRMQEIEAERKKDIHQVLELDNWLPASVKMKLEEEEQRQAQLDQQLEARRKKALATVLKSGKQATSRPTSGKKKK